MTASVTHLRRSASLILAAAALLALPAGAHAFSIGMSDQKVGMWEDPRFEQLGIDQVRLLVSYNQVLAGDFSRYDQWMAQAQARGADVLLTINQHSSMSKTRLPTIAQYRKVVRALRAAGARWRFSEPIRARRIPRYHTGPVEALDALEARFRAPPSGTFVITIGS